MSDVFESLGFRCALSASTEKSETYACAGAHERIEMYVESSMDDDYCEPRIVGATEASAKALLTRAGYACPIPTSKDACGKEEAGTGGYGSVVFVKKAKGLPAGMSIEFVYGPVRRL